MRMPERSKGDRRAGPWKVIFDTARISALWSIVASLGREGWIERMPVCHERQCHGRREISRRHSGIVLVKYKHSVVGKTHYPSFSSHYSPSPSPSQSHPPPHSMDRVGGSISFFVYPHLLAFLFLHLSPSSLTRDTNITLLCLFIFLYAHSGAI